MDSECNVNFGITWESAIELRSRPVGDFAREIAGLVPGLDQAERDQESGTLILYQLKGREKIREVRIENNSLQSAAGRELGAEEQAAFVRSVAQAATKLQLSMFDVKLVDLRHIYQVKHWGNHNDLIAVAMLGESPLHSVLAAIGGNLIGLRLGFVKEPADQRDLSMLVELQPATVPSEVHSGDYDGDRISILCGVARTGGFVRVQSLSEVLDDLDGVWRGSMRDAIIKYVDGSLRASAVSTNPKVQD